MPRRISYESREKIIALIEQKPDAVGPRLGYLAVTYNIPAQAFAQLIGASESTVYRWFYGKIEPPPEKMPSINSLVRILKAARKAGDIPLRGTYKKRMLAIRDVIIKHKSYTSGT